MKEIYCKVNEAPQDITICDDKIRSEVFLLLRNEFVTFPNFEKLATTKDKERYYNIITDKIIKLFDGWKSPEEVRRGKEMVREAFRFPK